MQGQKIVSEELFPPSDFPPGEPTFSVKAKIQQSVSFILVMSGLLLIGWGGWLFYQQQREANKPPPAPIVDSAAVFAATYTPQETPPSPTAPSQPVSEATPPAESTATLPSSHIPSPAASAIPPTSTGPQSVVDVADSLAGNPLIVGDTVLETNNEQPIDGPDFSDLPVEKVDTPLTRLVAESIDLDTPVTGVGWTEIVQNGQPVRVWTVAEHAAGWHQNSLLPGQGGNIVLSGHHNIKGEVFRYIVDLEIGDSLTLYTGDQPYEYTISDKFIVKDKGEPEEVRLANARWIGPFEDERVTLVTCWPYNGNTHRVIVIAKPVNVWPLDNKLLEGIPVDETTLQTQE